MVQVISEDLTGESGRFPPPWIWFFLNLPFGATSGFGSVALAYLASRAGMGDEVVAAIVAMNLLPQTLKFLESVNF